MVEEQSRDHPGDGEWLTVAAAARRLGISPRAVRGRIDRGTIASKPNGNMGRLVLVRLGDAVEERPGDGPGDELELLREELAEARVMIARLEEQVAAAKAVAVADVATARADVEAAQRAAAAECAAKDALVTELKAMLAEARRPWWWRLLNRS